MFTSGLVEARNNTVNIIDFDHCVVKGMLDFMYTGKTKYMTQRAEELLEIAEKYNISGLKDSCQHSLGKILRKENAAGLLVLADRNNAFILKEKATEFIKT